MIDNDPVSIIILYYNQAQYLMDLIYSVINQIYQDIEIIVNDGSSNNTQQIAEELQKLS